MEETWHFSSEGGFYQELDLVSYDATTWKPDVRQYFKSICISNVKKLILRHLNINSIRNKFDLFSKQIKGAIDVLMVSKTKLNKRFSEGLFLIEDFRGI